MAENSLLEKVLGLQEKYEALQAQLSDPEVISDMKKFVQLNKEYKELTPIIEAGNEFKKILENYEMAKDILATEKDEDLREMAKEEIAEIEPTLPDWEEKIKLLLIPADPQDSKNAILEIRGGSGGDEAAIFAGDLFRMYTKYCETRGWRMEITNQAEGALGDHGLPDSEGVADRTAVHITVEHKGEFVVTIGAGDFEVQLQIDGTGFGHAGSDLHVDTDLLFVTEFRRGALNGVGGVVVTGISLDFKIGPGVGEIVALCHLGRSSDTAQSHHLGSGDHFGTGILTESIHGQRDVERHF